MFDIKLEYQKLLYKRIYYKGIKNGKITPFSSDFYDSLSNTYISCLPVSLHIKYLGCLTNVGRCLDRSLYMFFALPGSTLVRGDIKGLELWHGSDAAMHGWIEYDGYVYDPTDLNKYDMKTYYDLEKPKNVTKCTLSEYLKYEGNKELYYKVINTKIDDYKKNGKYRYELATVIPLLEAISPLNQEFRNDLDKWLNIINYEEKEVSEELMKKLSIK